MPGKETACQFLQMASKNEPAKIKMSYFQSTSNLHVCELDSGLEALEVEAKPKLLGLSKVVTKPSDFSWLKRFLEFFTLV